MAEFVIRSCRDLPFCPKGCAHAYEHGKKCSSEGDLDPMAYGALTDEALLDTYDDLKADYHRYGGQPDGGHRPTALEAARRIGLVKGELLIRMKGLAGR